MMSVGAPVNPPRLLTSRGLIRAVAERWREQYCRTGTWYAEDKRTTYEGLSALDLDTASRDEVNRIIGNGSWTSIRCNGCNQAVETAVEVGDPPDYESATVTLCVDCVALAWNLLVAGFCDAR